MLTWDLDSFFPVKTKKYMWFDNISFKVEQARNVKEHKGKFRIMIDINDF